MPHSPYPWLPLLLAKNGAELCHPADDAPAPSQESMRGQGSGPKAGPSPVSPLHGTRCRQSVDNINPICGGSRPVALQAAERNHTRAAAIGPMQRARAPLIAPLSVQGGAGDAIKSGRVGQQPGAFRISRRQSLQPLAERPHGLGRQPLSHPPRPVHARRSRADTRSGRRPRDRPRRRPAARSAPCCRHGRGIAARAWPARPRRPLP